MFGKPRVFLKAINDKGQVVGMVRLYTEKEPLIMSYPISILWDGGTAVWLSGMQEGEIETIQGINNQGQNHPRCAKIGLARSNILAC